MTCGQPPLQAPSSTGRDARPQSAPPRPPARGGGALRGGGRGGGSAPSRGGGPWPPFQVRWARHSASPAGGWCLAEACVGKGAHAAGRCLAGGPGRGFGLAGQPLRRARRARGGQPKVLRGAEGWYHCQRPDTVRSSSCLCIAGAGCAAVLTQHQAWSDVRGLLQSAAGVAGARRYACWGRRRRCWA